MGAAALAIHESIVTLRPWDVNDETKLTSDFSCLKRVRVLPVDSGADMGTARTTQGS